VNVVVQVVGWVRVAPLLGALGLPLALLHGADRAKFSDSKEAPLLPEAATKNPFIERSLSGLPDRNSSLDAAKAIPFSSVQQAPLTKSLTTRERELLEDRSSWILRTPGELVLSEENANKAFGVREFKLELKDTAETRPKGNLERYYDRLGEKETVRPEDFLNDQAARHFGLAGAGRVDAPLGNSAEALPGDGRPSLGAVGSPVSLPLRDGRPGGGVFEASRASMREMFGENTRTLFQPAPNGPNLTRDLRERAEDFRKNVLGVGSASPLETRGALVESPLAGRLDPINTQPDLTRQELNPVVGRGIAELTGATSPGALDSLKPASAWGLKPSFSDALLPRSFGPAAGLRDPLGSGLEQPRGPAFSPTILELPRRSF